MATDDERENPLQTVLDRIRAAASGSRVSVREVFASTGENSFGTALLVVSLVMVSPLSGIPTLPTIGALLIALIAVQWMAARDHLWLPDWIMRKSVDAEKVRTALSWLDRPARLIDRIARPRLSALTHRPLGALPLIVILCVVATWPLLELLPFFTTICAVGVALLAFGLTVKDGLFVLAGFLYIAALALAAVAVGGAWAG